MPAYRIKNTRSRILMPLVNFFGYAIWGWSRLSAPPLNQVFPKKILVLLLDEIGDVLLATPALHRLRKIYPQAKIAVAVRRPGYAILSANPDIDDLILVDLPRFSARPSGLLADLKNIKKALPVLMSRLKEPYDLGLDLRADLRTIYLLKKIGLPIRVSQSIRGGGFWLTHIPPYHGELHEAERKLEIVNFLRPNFNEKVDGKLRIAVAPEKKRQARLHLSNSGITESHKFAVIHPFAGWPPKQWPAERFAEISRYLAIKHRLKVVIIGAPQDKPAADKIVSLSNQDGVVSLAGAIDLKTTAAIIEHASLFIGNDSGPMHLACAVQTPVIALFGQNTPHRYGPWQNKNITLYHQVECSPCPQTECRRRPNCLELISIDEVMKAIVTLLPK